MNTLMLIMVVGSAVLCLLSILLSKIPIDTGNTVGYLFLASMIALPTAAAMYFIPGGPAVQAIVLAAGAVVFVLASLRLAGKL